MMQSLIEYTYILCIYIYIEYLYKLSIRFNVMRAKTIFCWRCGAKIASFGDASVEAHPRRSGSLSGSICVVPHGGKDPDSAVLWNSMPV